MKTLLFAALPLLIGCTEVVIDPIIEPPTPLAPRVRIATFNVHRFFDTVCDSGDCGPGAFEDLLSQEQFEARADELAQAIEALDADVILLQEIETQGCLDALVSRTEGRFSGQFAELGPAATVDVAVLSRLQMIGVERHRPALQLADNSSSIFSRKLLEVHLSVAGTRVIVFASHLRSKANDEPLRRLAEAEVAADLALARAAEFPGALVVLGGDMNDTPDSPPIDAIEDRGLLRVASDLNNAATFIFNGTPQAIDHLMLAPGVGEYVAGSASVVEPGGVGYGGSDHSTLVADFLLQAARLTQ
jgi:uncharacterized protein